MTPEDVAKRADDLIRGLCDIPVDELIECARGNLKATRMTRLSKDHPEGVAEPDFGVRQKALEWIGAMIGAAPVGQRKPTEKRAEKKDKSAPAARGKEAE